MNRHPTATWNAKQERVALLLATGRSVKAAAAEAGAGERTVHTWLEDRNYRSLVNELRAELLNEAVGKLAESANKAVQTLRDLLDDGNASVRLRAAFGVMDYLLKVREHAEVEARLTKLEKFANEVVPDYKD